MGNQRRLACMCFLIFHLGANYSSSQQQTLGAYIEVASGGYTDPQKAPYHNWNHAVDVTHAVFRLLNLCQAARYFSDNERFALVVSAVCHDVGHPGFNNPFLIETAHELAIRYNDRSPLENMHSARLFEIISQPRAAVFANLDKQAYKEVRQVIIDAILHTDNIHHFAMIKELQVLYEVNSDAFDIALQMYQQDVDFPPVEICDLFSEAEKRKVIRNLILHVCDISNPMKPFKICSAWAWNVMNEFFAQGDQEKELGIAVQALNDRDKVNMPYSQLGFIEFFAAPLAFATVRILLPMAPCANQLMDNLAEWSQVWADTTKPTPSEEELLKVKERIGKLEAKIQFIEGCF